MKLLYCPHCHDIFNLVVGTRKVCICGMSYGEYTTHLHATISAHAIPLGIANDTLSRALYRRPLEGLGERFTAFVIPIDCPTITITSSEIDKCVKVH